MIGPRWILLLLLSLVVTSRLARAQEIMVRGVVRDAARMPLIGVSVMRVGTREGVSTNLEGRFSLKARVGDKLRFSFIGMKPLTRTASAEEMLITLQEDVQQIEEAVVTGYQKIKSRAYTGATSQVKLADIKLEGVSDVSRMLEGRVAGLSVQNVSGSFGAAPRINIRGGASIIGNVQPLWVIDGVVYEDLVHLSMEDLASGDASTLISSAVSGLNAADIQDIQVLKDASATSVYGARALNGVIVVSTKSGRRQSPLKVSYAMEGTVRQRPSYSDFDLLGSSATLGIYQEMQSKGYFTLEQMLYGRRGGIYHQMYTLIKQIDPKTGAFRLENTPEARAAYLQGREHADTDWFRHLFRLSPMTHHTLSLTSGGEQSATYASVSYMHDPGWTIADKVSRLTAKLKSSFYLGDKFELMLSLDGNTRKQQGPGTMPQKKNIVIGGYERDFDINPFAYALGTSRLLRPYAPDGSLEYYRNNWAPFNILNEYRNNYMDIALLDLKGQLEAVYKPFKGTEGLELRGLFSVRRASTSMAHYIHEGSNLVKAWRAAETPQVVKENIYLWRNPDDPTSIPRVALTHGGMYLKTDNSLTSYLGRFSLDYNKAWARHDLKLFAFAEIRSADRESSPFSGYGIQYDRGNQVHSNPLIFNKLSDNGSAYFALSKRYDRGMTFSASGTYGYKGKYIANAVFNYEGSNASGGHAHNRWLPTWNVGVKWNADQERPLRGGQTAISKLALRASYGLTAKMNEEAINAQAVYANRLVNRYRFDDRENALDILFLENRDLTWEKMFELNLGLELGLWNNRLSATLDLYQRNAFDLIDLIRTSGVGGQYYKYANFGDMRTRGIELSLRHQNIRARDFSWETTLSLGFMRQEITRLLNSPNTFDMVAGRGRGNVVGFPKGALFSFNFQGLNEEGLPTFDFGLYPSNASPLSRIAGADFLDTQYAKTYLIYHGPTEPTVTGGLANTFRYKRWELSLFVTMQAGSKLRLNPSFDPAFVDLNVFSRAYERRWLSRGDELRTDVPTIPSAEQIARLGRERIERAYNTYNYSQLRVADGSFVRLKNISLGYTLPERLSKQLRLSQLQLKLSITNPLLIYADRRLEGQDPEYYQSGGVSLPTPRQYTLTLHVGL